LPNEAVEFIVTNVMSPGAHILLVGAFAAVLTGVALASSTNDIRAYFSGTDTSAAASSILEQTYNQRSSAVPTTAKPSPELGTISTEPPDAEPPAPPEPVIPPSMPNRCVYADGAQTNCFRDCDDSRFWPDSICNPCLDRGNLREVVCYVPY